METLISRYRNVSLLVALVFAQLLGLAVQVKRSNENQSTRLIRLWTVSAITPVEKAIAWMQGGTGNMWRSYVYLRGVRQENRDLKYEIERLRLEQVRLEQDAAQAHRLQALLDFKEKYIAKTVAAQVIGSSGSEQSRSIFLDKGENAGITKDMAVITADGVVGKVLRAYRSTSQVLLINDQSSGVGAILESTRLQGVLRGTTGGEVILEKVMTDNQVQPGEKVLTSGGDQIFPKGMPVGFVTKVSPGAELFLNIRIRPAANLSRLEEVLVITQKEDRAAASVASEAVRAVDVLAQRLPSVPPKPAADSAKTAPSAIHAGSAASNAGSTSSAIAITKPVVKPASAQKVPAPVKVSEQITKTAAGGQSANPKPSPTPEEKPQ
ncbi:MAG: rod shape-determining protein MreC [Acidobacteria bacterium]|nr:MAG: rod shape-determining protein MreC [Acidobacteriota bacterium]